MPLFSSHARHHCYPHFILYMWTTNFFYFFFHFPRCKNPKQEPPRFPCVLPHNPSSNRHHPSSPLLNCPSSYLSFYYCHHHHHYYYYSTLTRSKRRDANLNFVFFFLFRFCSLSYLYLYLTSFTFKKKFKNKRSWPYFFSFFFNSF